MVLIAETAGHLFLINHRVVDLQLHRGHDFTDIGPKSISRLRHCDLTPPQLAHHEHDNY